MFVFEYFVFEELKN